MTITQKSVRFAVHPADQGRIEQLPGCSNTAMTQLPNAGDSIILPFLVDPHSRLPVPVLVGQVLLDYSPEFVVIVVTRAQ